MTVWRIGKSDLVHPQQDSFLANNVTVSHTPKRSGPSGRIRPRIRPRAARSTGDSGCGRTRERRNRSGPDSPIRCGAQALSPRLARSCASHASDRAARGPLAVYCDAVLPPVCRTLRDRRRVSPHRRCTPPPRRNASGQGSASAWSRAARATDAQIGHDVRHSNAFRTRHRPITITPPNLRQATSCRTRLGRAATRARRD